MLQATVVWSNAGKKTTTCIFKRLLLQEVPAIQLPTGGLSTGVMLMDAKVIVYMVVAVVIVTMVMSDVQVRPVGEFHGLLYYMSRHTAVMKRVSERKEERRGE